MPSRQSVNDNYVFLEQPRQLYSHSGDPLQLVVERTVIIFVDFKLLETSVNLHESTCKRQSLEIISSTPGHECIQQTN